MSSDSGSTSGSDSASTSHSISDSEEDDEENYRQNRVTIHETNRSLYDKTDLEASFLSYQETSSFSVAITGKPEDDPMMASVFKEFSESYNQANKNWGGN